MDVLKLQRRQWLQTTTGLLAGCVFTSRSLAQTKGREAIRFSVVSDTHIGRKDNDSARRQWEKAVQEINANESAFALHLGDVVDGGRVNQYPVYKEVRKQLSIPIHEIPGNHDPDEAFKKHVRAEIDTVIEQEWLRIILMKNAHRDSHDGFFESSQLDWFEEQCAETKKQGKFALICCHVPVHTNRPPDRAWYVKPDHGQNRYYEIVDKYADCLLGSFHGHFHNGLRGWDDRKLFHEICFPSVVYNQKRGLEEKKAPGYNPDEFRAGYANVTIANGEMKIAYRPIGAVSNVQKTLKSV